MNRIKGRWGAVLCCALLVLGFSGCTFQVVENIYATWDIAGSTATSECSAFGIDRWAVAADGPESVDFSRDCRNEDWNTGQLLYNLLEGPYTVSVRALSSNGTQLAENSTSLTLVSGFPEDLRFDFAANFGVN
jgi:hypothetical protein